MSNIIGYLKTHAAGTMRIVQKGHTLAVIIKCRDGRYPEGAIVELDQHGPARKVGMLNLEAMGGAKESETKNYGHCQRCGSGLSADEPGPYCGPGCTF